jgi:UDP-N-acetylmuramate--alanine ligase
MALSYHFSGIAGAGMNPLARLMAAWGNQVQGSDRSIDAGKNLDVAKRLSEVGIAVKPQDGSAVAGSLQRFVYSTAVEQETPEFLAARKLGLELVPRPALLAEVVNRGKPGIAIAGTSGKSTVTGMLAWIVRQAQLPATVIGGAALVGEGVAGGLAVGPQEGPVIAEACESDGTLIGYRPALGLVHNITRDHAEIAKLRRQFETFAGQCETLLVNADCAEARTLRGKRTVTYGRSGDVDVRLNPTLLGSDDSAGEITFRSGKSIEIRLRHPGLHNLENATAAAALANELGIGAERIAGALATFPGVARRFEVIGTTDTCIRVVDDYAHNGEKIRAVITAAQVGCERLIAIFQPHGFGPARFLRPELKELLPQILRPQDRFCYAEIYYAGGTVAKDISSSMLADDMPEQMECKYACDHNEVLRWATEVTGPGDTVLLMGARDPELPNLARALFDLL